LGSCIVGWFNEKKLRKLFDIPSSRRPMIVVTLGYSTQSLREKKRKTAADIIKYNTY